MVMKVILVVLMVLVVPGHVNGNDCTPLSQRRSFTAFTRGTRCNAPSLSVVKLPVPDGYDYLKPSAVKLKRCNDLYCDVFHDFCYPVPGQTKTHTFRVTGGSVTNSGLQEECVTVEVEEHMQCKCRCPNDCREGKVFNDKTCGCDCDPALEKMCQFRINHMKESVMWSEDTCSCHCDNKRNCSYGEWDPNECRCI